MTASAWCALAVALLITALPASVTVRAEDLAGGGRLVARAPARRWRVTAVPGRPLAAAAAAGAVALIAMWAGPALAVAAAAVLAVGAQFWRDAVRARRSGRRHRELLTALRVLVGELEAGAQPAAALAAAGAVGPAAAVLGRAAELVRRGDDPSEVFGAAGPELHALGAAWRVSETSGAAPAEVLGRVALDVAAVDERRRAVTVALAGPRSSALVLSLLPLVGIGLGTAMDADPLALLFGAPVGRLLCCGGVLLDVAGLMWIRALVRRAER